MVTVDGESVRALAYPALVGSPRVGDRVLLNTTALDRELGTGGYAFVVALPDRLPPDSPRTDTATASPQAGHIVKSRYTPLQAMVASVDEQGSPHHELLRDAGSVEGMPVVVADLHSALPAILAGIFSGGSGARGDGGRGAPHARTEPPRPLWGGFLGGVRGPGGGGGGGPPHARTEPPRASRAASFRTAAGASV